jgi:hypothetical protein
MQMLISPTTSPAGWQALITRIVCELEQLADHGARGTRQGLLDHLKYRLGDHITPDLMLAALEQASLDVSERFN